MGSGRVLGESWAGPGLLMGILVGFWEALGLSWAAAGLLLGRLGHSWATLRRSWTLSGALERLWGLLGRQVGAKLGPKRAPEAHKNQLET